MTRDRFRDIQMAALYVRKANVEAFRKNPLLHSFVRDELESRYQAIVQKQEEWERGGFWTEENEKRYKDLYKRLN